MDNKVRLVLVRLFFIMAAIAAFFTGVQGQATKERYSGKCETTANVVTDGRSSTNKFDRIHPSCTVTVYDQGTLTLATLYSDYAGTPLSNPLTANTNGTYSFVISSGRYDIVTSNAGISPPVTVAGVFIASSTGLAPTCTINQLIYYASSGTSQMCLTLGTGLSITAGVLNVSAISSAYDTVQEEGSSLTQRSTLNFIGSGLTASDSSSPARTNVTVASPLNALASNSTAGFWAPTGAVTGNARTILGTANEISVANGNGSSDPVIGLPSSITLTGKTLTGGTFVNSTLTTPTINVGSDAQGDIYYRNGAGVFTRLPIGTASQQLKVNAGATAPEWATASTTGLNVRNATNVMVYGCVGNGIADDTTCINNAYIAAIASTGQTLYFPAGTYLFDGLSIAGSNLIVVGDGPEHSILFSRINTTPVIGINNTAAARNGITIRDISLKGFGSGSGNHGLASSGANAFNSLTVDNVKIYNVGGSAVLATAAVLSNARFTDLDLDQPAAATGHTFDVLGGGAGNIIARTYAHNVADNLTAFRLREGNWFLNSVTAQDTGTGTGWGIVGQDVTNDGVSTLAFLQCEECLVQLWGGADGIDLRSGSYGSFYSTAFSTASSGAGKRALRFRGMTNGTAGTLDASSSFTLNGTATWQDSKPVHSVEPPFIEIGSQEIVDYRDTGVGGTVDLSSVRQLRGSGAENQRAAIFLKRAQLSTTSGEGLMSDLRFTSDNTYNIGTSGSGQRPANMYAASEVWAGNAFRAGAPAGSTGEIRMHTSSNSNTLRLKSGIIGVDYTWTFPTSIPGAGNNCLQIDNNGNVSITGSACAVSAAAGGSNTQVQYNNAGTLGGTSGFTSDGTNVTAGSGNLRATRPRFTTSIDDTNGNEIFGVTATGSAVNEITVANAATGTNPSFTATGGDSDVGINMIMKGAGVMGVTGPMTITSTSANCLNVGPNGATNPVIRGVCNVASAATGISVTGNAAGSGATINTLSSVSNENLFVFSKGTGSVAVSNGSFTPTSNVALHVEKAAISGREIMGKFTVSDGGNSAFFVNNTTNNNSLYVPTMSGYLDSVNTAASFAMTGFVSAANDASDSATGGIVALQVNRTDSATDPLNGTLSAVANRKVFSIANFTTSLLVIPAAGALNQGSTGALQFASTASAAGTMDTGIVRSAASTLRATNASTGAGNLILGTSAGAIGTSGAGVLAFTLSTAPSTSPTDTVQVYSNDAAAADHNLYTRNEAGAVNRITGLGVRNSAQFDKTSSTTFSTVTGLSFNVEASRTYAFRATLQTTANVAGGVKFQVGGTATATAISYEGILYDTAALGGQTRATALATTVCAVTTSTAGTCKIEGVIQVNAAGTLTIDFAQNASNGAASSVLANQYFQLIPIN